MSEIITTINRRGHAIRIIPMDYVDDALDYLLEHPDMAVPQDILPRELYIIRYPDGTCTAVDNTDGYVWMEDWRTERWAVMWLTTMLDTEIIRQQERDELDLKAIRERVAAAGGSS